MSEGNSTPDWSFISKKLNVILNTERDYDAWLKTFDARFWRSDSKIETPLTLQELETLYRKGRTFYNRVNALANEQKHTNDEVKEKAVALRKRIGATLKEIRNHIKAIDPKWDRTRISYQRFEETPARPKAELARIISEDDYRFEIKKPRQERTSVLIEKKVADGLKELSRQYGISVSEIVNRFCKVGLRRATAPAPDDSQQI